MATEPSFPTGNTRTPEDRAQLPPSTHAQESDVLETSLKWGTAAQVVIAVGVIFAIFYTGRLFLVTVMVSVLIAFLLEPAVNGLERLRLPRPAGALLAVVLALGLAGMATYFLYNRAVEFAHNVPQYARHVQEYLGDFRRDARKLEESTETLLSGTSRRGDPMPVEVKETDGLAGVAQGPRRVAEVILAISFVPFLIYFMLTWKDHARSATVRLFPLAHRATAYRTLGKMARMIRGFLVGSVLAGAITATLSALVFWWLDIRYALVAGILSGFLTLIPYLGIVLALLPPLMGGIGTLDRQGLLVVVVTVVVLHLLAVNVLYPKVVGSRLRLNPLAVTLALLFWSWLWGAAGLILAVPMLGGFKIVCDHVQPLRGLGEWLGEPSR